MPVVVRRQPHSLLPDLPEWFDPFSLLGLGVAAGGHGIRVEDSVTDELYTLRAELPGIDPEKDVSITVADGVLTIRAERSEEKVDRHHSEFRYGSFHRTLTLPAGAREDAITAAYDAGILTIEVPLTRPPAEPKKITIKRSA